MSALEDLLAFQIKAAKLPPPEREVALIPGRRFKWDFVWRRKGYDLEEDRFFDDIAVEVQGGIWNRGAHGRGTGITRDATKANLAALAGFRTLFFTGDMVKDGSALETLRKALA